MLQAWQEGFKQRLSMKLGVLIVLLIAALIVALRPWSGDASAGKVPVNGGTGTPAGSDADISNDTDDTGIPLLRLHVVANSDKDVDQSVKYEVRDVITRYWQDRSVYSDGAGTIADTLARVADHRETLEQLVREVLDRLGSPYDVQVLTGKFLYDGRYYGDLWVPPGRYPAIQVVLGDGQGANWWCVLFSPVCAVPPAAVSEDLVDDTPPAVGMAEDGAVDRAIFLTADGQLLVTTTSYGYGMDDTKATADEASEILQENVEIRSALWDWLSIRWPVPLLAAQK